MPLLAMPPVITSATGSSTPSEEGFVSGSSADDSTYVDRLAVDFGAFNLNNTISNGLTFFEMTRQEPQPLQQQKQHQHSVQQQKCPSDSGMSSCEVEHANGFLNNEFPDRMTAEDIITSSNQGPVNQPVEGGPPVPGAWYFEIGSDDGSPNCDFHDDFSTFRAALSMNSRNVTESVEVPSSEHVAEIVGRQGCKIKVLRAKTNTYIKTPVRGEDPIFVVTGRPEDVADAKREIECAAEHFTQIRASRRHSQGGAPAPGHITAYVRVPLRVVGLVVGPKGATIKRIQQDTHTYIITPSREREPIFEVTGLPQNVEAARREIEQHIYQRTGNMPITDTSASIEAYDLQGSLASAASHRTSNVSYGALAQSVRRPSAIDALQNNYDLLKNSPDMAFNLMRTGAFYSNGVSSPPSQSSNSSNASPQMLYNSLDLCAVGALNAQTLLQQQQFQRRDKQATNLLMSSGDSSLNSSTTTSTAGNCAYPAWSSAYTSSSFTVNNNSEAQNQYYQSIAQAFHNQDQVQSRAPFVPLFSNFGQACGGAALQDVNSLHVEDLSDSLKMRADQIDFDPYHLMKSIWSDLDSEKTAGSVDSAAAVATA